MMDHDAQLKLQSFVDGELPEHEAREVASWLARDGEATGLFDELRNTRKAMKDAEPTVRLPESREFYWSKIQKGIEHLEKVPPLCERPSGWNLLRRMLIPASAVAVLAIVVATGVHRGLWGSPPGAITEMTVADSGAFTYHDYANETTLVWISYPAER
jgi:anti-sigma factor RsiW